MAALLTRDDLLRNQLYSDGQWLSRTQQFKVTNPADGQLIAKVADASADDYRHAIAAAERAWPTWRDTSCEERARLLRSWYEEIMAHQQPLAEIMTMEQGKPLHEAAGEVAYGASFILWFAEEARRIRGDILPTFKAGQQSRVIYQSVGVAGAITPWNFPNAMITRKAGPALAAGCPIIVKPPQLTPLSALALAVLAERVGIPAGVFNVLPTADARMAGEHLTQTPAVRKLSFTGSTPVGKSLMRQAADQVTKVSLELGGNAPFIVFDDADPKLAVKELLACKFRNAGQTCISANRILVQNGIYQDFVTELTAAMEQLQLGSGLTQPDADLGPLINQAAVDKAQHLLNDALNRGAHCELGGQIATELGPLFFQPTLVTGITQDMAITTEEIFAPIVAIQRFTDEASGIRLANDTPYGLAAYFCASEPARIHRVSEQLEAGLVGINAGGISHAMHPFGGVKESGLGREGSHLGVAEYLEAKTLIQGGLA